MTEATVEHEVEEQKPIKEKSNSRELPTDRKILDTLYGHYGKPDNIYQEKVRFYFGYTSPAGWHQADWLVDGWQQGRVNVYIKEDDKSSLLGGSPRILEEGVGTWFIGVKDNEIKVYVGGKLDVILKVEK